MQQFELRFLDKLEVVVVVRAYMARDDLDALKEAERLCDAHHRGMERRPAGSASEQT
jgi:hypothetical protein